MRYIVLLLFAFLWACTATTKSKVLSFFFDGVPGEEIDSIPTIGLKKDSLIATRDTVRGMVYAYSSIHEPYKKKDCNACHVKNDVGKLVREEPELCYLCHDQFSEIFDVLHGPVDAGFCSSCHQPHMSKNAALQLEDGNKLCFPCHIKEEVERPKAHMDIGDDPCIKCHDPHGKNDPHYIRKPIKLER